MSFATLALVGLIALAGPLLALPSRWQLPVLIGELAAGIAFGHTGFRVLHATNSTFAFLADVGFGLIMFVAGSHVPIGDARLNRGVIRGLGQAVFVAAVAVPLAFAVSAGFGTHHTALYAVLIASSSAALVLPVVTSLKLDGPGTLPLLAQVAIADTGCIVALPLVIDPHHAGRAALGAVAVIAAASLLFVALRWVERHGLRRRLHRLSERRKFALELRISLIILFGLAALATQMHISIMLAGFSFGLVTAGIGEPRRLARQLFAITEGFFGPLFFVWLGASLDLRELGQRPSYLALGFALGGAAALAHAAARVLGQPIPLGVLAAAQVGVPVAAATIGSQLGLFQRGEASAVLLGAVVTIALATAGGSLAARRAPNSRTTPLATSSQGQPEATGR